MENMLHLAPSSSQALALDRSSVFSREHVPPAVSAVTSLPVIDMSRSRDEVRRAILDAGMEFGFFLVVEHGIPEEVMRDMLEVCEEFFQLPAASKAYMYSEDSQRPNRIFSGTTYDTGGDKYWRDCLRLACPSSFPVGTRDDWPHTPQRLRGVVERFTALTRGLGVELLRLLSEAMGIRPDYFEGDISAGDVVLNVNHYPPCPSPEKTLGLPPHCDRNLITLLLQGSVYGLDVAYRGEWIKVEPMPGAFVVNFGQQLEVVTNGLLKSVEHRVVTSSTLARTAVATFIMPTPDCLIGPSKEFLAGDKPPCYRTIRFGDFMRMYNTVKLGSSINQTTDLKNVQKKI